MTVTAHKRYVFYRPSTVPRRDERPRFPVVAVLADRHRLRGFVRLADFRFPEPQPQDPNHNPRIHRRGADPLGLPKICRLSYLPSS